MPEMYIVIELDEPREFQDALNKASRQGYRIVGCGAHTHEDQRDSVFFWWAVMEQREDDE